MNPPLLQPRLEGGRFGRHSLPHRSGSYKSVESITGITILNLLDIESRLEDIIELKDGWLDGKGTAFNPDDLRKLAKDFEQYYDTDLPLPCLYPSPDSLVEAEWDIGRNAVSLEIALPYKTAYYHNLNLDTKEIDEAELDISEASGWDELNIKLQTLTKGMNG